MDNQQLLNLNSSETHEGCNTIQFMLVLWQKKETGNVLLLHRQNTHLFVHICEEFEHHV